MLPMRPAQFFFLLVCAAWLQPTAPSLHPHPKNASPHCSQRTVLAAVRIRHAHQRIHAPEIDTAVLHLRGGGRREEASDSDESDSHSEDLGAENMGVALTKVRPLRDPLRLSLRPLLQCA